MAQDGVTCTNVDLSGRGLKCIPNDLLSKAGSIDSLDLSGNRGIQLGNVNKFTNIVKLRLCNCGLDTFPEELLDLSKLQELDLSFNPLQSFPQCLTSLSQLRTLQLRSCSLSEIPELMAQMTCLQELDLSNNPLRSFPQFLTSLSQLRTLKLSLCRLSKIPERMAQMTCLQELDLSSNPLQSFPQCLTSPSQLRTLQLTSCSLSEIPELMAQMTCLQELDLSHNPLQSFPLCLTSLSQLRTLKLWSCRLSKIPEWMAQMTCLESLDVRYNALHDFPVCVLQLANLRRLNLSNDPFLEDAPGNSIKELPVQLADNVVLETLNLDGNPMKLPPVEICKQGFEAIKSYLKAIIPGGELMCADTINMLGDSEAGKTSIAQSLLSGQPCPAPVDGRTQVMQQLQAKFGDKLVHVNDFGGHEIYQAVLTVFLPSSGLVLLAYDMAKESSSVQQHCISADISNLQEGTSGGGSNQIRERTEAAESVEKEVARWLLTVLAKSESVRVVVVGTHADEITVDRRELLEKQMREHTEELLKASVEEIRQHIRQLKPGSDASHGENKVRLLARSLTIVKDAKVDVVTVSCKESDPAGGLARLHFIVSEKLKPCSHMPASWCLVMKDILDYTEGDATGLALLTWEQAGAICRKHLLLEDVEHSLVVILRYLVSTSQIIWIEKHEFLRRFVICRPQCIIEVCKKVLHHDERRALKCLLGEDQETRFRESYLKGCINEECLRMLLCHTWEGGSRTNLVNDFESKFKVVIEFMEHFNLISKVRDDKFASLYVLPTLLPNVPPPDYERVTDGRVKLSIKIQLTFLGSLIPQAFFETNLLSVLTLVHSMRISPAIWKDGVIFERDGVSLVMSRPTGKNILEISAYPDSEEQNMWPHLQRVLRCINANVMHSWKGAPPFCVVTCPGCRCCGRHDTSTAQRGCSDTTLEELATTIVPLDVSYYQCPYCRKRIPRSLCLPHFSGTLPTEDQRQVKIFFEDLRKNCSLLVRDGTGPGGPTPSLPVDIHLKFKKARKDLIDELDKHDVLHIMDVLYQERNISETQRDEIQAQANRDVRSQTARCLVDIIDRRGDKAIRTLLAILESDELNKSDLARKVHDAKL